MDTATARRDKLDYDLTTPTDVRSYLNHHHRLSNFHLQPLSGGTANYVYRLTDHNTGQTQILKHAAPQLASSQAFSLDTVRMDFEASMLLKKTDDERECSCTPESKTTHQADTLPPEKTHVHTVPLIFYEPDTKLLCLADAGPRNLKDAYPHLSPSEIHAIGTALGSWLANLHASTPLSHVTARDGRNNPIGVSIAGYTYRNLASALESHIDPDDAAALSEEIRIRAADLIPTDNESVCHGDFWPGNVMLASTPDSQHHLLTVIDWELVRVGSSATDIGQFAAEAMMLDRFHGQKGLRRTFMRAYFQTREEVKSWEMAELKQWMVRIGIHYAVHLVVWPGRGVHWASGKDTRAVGREGVDVLEHAVSDAPDVMSWSVFDGLEGIRME